MQPKLLPSNDSSLTEAKSSDTISARISRPISGIDFQIVKLEIVGQKPRPRIIDSYF